MAYPYDKEPRRLAAAAARGKVYAKLGIDPADETAIAQPEVRAKVRVAVKAAVTPFIEAKDKADAELKEAALAKSNT